MGGIRQRKDRQCISIITVAGGVVAFVVVHYFMGDNCFTDDISVTEICKVMIGLWGTLLGFIITALSVLVALDTEKGIIKVLIESNHFGTVLYTFLFAGAMMLMGIMFATAVVLLNSNSLRAFSLTVAMIAMIFVSLIFCIFFMFTILKRFDG